MRYSASVALGNVDNVTVVVVLMVMVNSTLVPTMETAAEIYALRDIVRKTPSLVCWMSGSGKAALLKRSADKEELVRAAVARSYSSGSRWWVATLISVFH